MKTQQNNVNKQIFAVANSQKQMLWAMAIIILVSIVKYNHIRIPESDIV